MTRIEGIVASIPDMASDKRARFRQSADRVLAKNSDDADARRLLEALDKFESNLPQKRISSGHLEWDSSLSGSNKFQAYYGDKVVGYIFKDSNHSNANKDVYSVWLHNQQLPGKFRFIEEARKAGEDAFSKKGKGL